MTDFLSQKYEETRSEAEHLRTLLKIATNRLSNAHEIIQFYSNPNNYRFVKDSEDGEVYHALLRDDFTEADGQKRTYIGGARARAYLNRLDEENSK